MRSVSVRFVSAFVTVAFQVFNVASAFLFYLIQSVAF
jgi:hypothetical protein